MTIDFAKIRREVPGALSVTELAVLAETAHDAKCALEVGHYYGRSTIALLLALPATSELTTIDHHRGDAWSAGLRVEDFMENVRRFTDRAFGLIDADFRDALAHCALTFDYVFYDADHSAGAVADFWQLVEPRLAPECTLVYDDADWPEQATLRAFAETRGFGCSRTRSFYRGELDKKDPETYTLEVMRR